MDGFSPIRPLPEETPRREDDVNGLDLLFGKDPKAKVMPTAEPDVNGVDLLFGNPSKPAAPPKPSNADLTYDYDKTLGFTGEAKGSFASDENEWMRAAAQTLYPNQPVDDAVKRIGKTKEGRYFHKGDDGQIYEVRPPSGMAKYVAGAGAAVGPAVPAVTGSVTGIMTMPLTGPGALPAAGAGAGFGELARQGIGDLILGDASTKTVNYDPFYKEFLVGALGQGVGVGMGKFLQRYTAEDIDRLSQASADHLYDLAQRHGIRITPAEATNLQSQIAEQKRLIGVPRSANQMGDFYTARNQEVAGAWRNALDRIAPGQDAGRLGENTRAIADNIVERVQGARTAAVSPLYQNIERQAPFVNPRDVVQFVEQQLPQAKGSDRKALEFALSQLRTTGGEATDASFRGLNSAKQAIDTLMANEDLATRQGIDRTAYGTLEQIRQRIIQAIDNAPGVGQQYQAARATYGDLSRTMVEPVQQALAPFMRINPQQGTMLTKAGQAVLDPATRSPELVAAARREFVNAGQEGAWNAVLRNFLQQEGAAAMKENVKGEVVNVGGNIAKRFPTEKTMPNLRAAMSPQQFAEFNDLMDLFRATGRAVDANSDTAFKQEALRQAKLRDQGAIAKTIGLMRPLDWAKRAQEFFGDRSYKNQADVIAQIITSGDRQAISRLRALKSYNGSDWNRMALMGDVLVRGGYWAPEMTDGD
jgi:hypothetical protein